MIHVSEIVSVHDLSSLIQRIMVHIISISVMVYMYMYIHMQVMRPMVRIAREVIAANGYSDVISVVPKRSTDMTERDMEGGRANILVTEVFDTELIGEGALVTYSHALQHLMEVRESEREKAINLL